MWLHLWQSYSSCDSLEQYKFIGRLCRNTNMEKERKKLGLPALRYLVCEGGSCPIFKQAKVYKHLALLVNARTP
ncbi:uncharacterized protein EURHEDRAFT_119224 [Aspergillus ruber CBS 135680]|uniref:Uncharacterized protein n=1 Tax=Aspergillus ruber (strain CBS 135680) TaxID=1388766 RepID=A0A017SPK4_ASPRC|nr:uncharacterized protein EURHEDRAFT_119224 [Aspergillus ruber CBS 135680]EYE98913.1 hypothetical protein EURHEDRAFT_119224 [Aspergillus ruber CBS 135680]